MLDQEADMVFKGLADTNRREMIHLLGLEELTVGQIERRVGLSQSATSQHLRLLLKAGLVRYRKHGNFRYYSVNADKLKAAMAFFDELWDMGLSRLKTNLED